MCACPGYIEAEFFILILESFKELFRSFTELWTDESGKQSQVQKYDRMLVLQLAL